MVVGASPARWNRLGVPKRACQGPNRLIPLHVSSHARCPNTDRGDPQKRSCPGSSCLVIYAQSAAQATIAAQHFSTMARATLPRHPNAKAGSKKRCVASFDNQVFATPPRDLTSKAASKKHCFAQLCNHAWTRFVYLCICILTKVAWSEERDASERQRRTLNSDVNF